MIKNRKSGYLFAALGVLCLHATVTTAKEPKTPDQLASAAEAPVAEFKASIKTLSEKRDAARQRLDAVFNAEFKKQRGKLLKRLDEELKAAMQAGNLDEAIALRDLRRSYEKIKTPADERSTTEAAARQRLEEVAAEIAVVLRESDQGREQLRKQFLSLIKSPPISILRAEARIPGDAVQWRGHHYLRVENGANEYVAQLRAEALGGHLVRIESKAEQRFVADLIKSGPHGWYYVDGNDREKEGDFVWSNGKRVTYFDPTKGKPPVNRQQHQMEIVREDGSFSVGKSGWRKGYIVEWDQ